MCLEPEAHHHNHVGTIHAGAIFSLAEAASGHALLNHIDLDANETLVVLRSSKVKYRKPATSRLIALAFVEQDSISVFIQQMEAKKRAFIDVHVRITDGRSEEVFAGKFSWFASRKKKS